MHTVREIEANIQRQLADHRQTVEHRIEEASRRNEETFFHRAEEVFGSQILDLRRFIDAEIPPLKRRIEEVRTLCREESDCIRQQLEPDIESVRSEVTDIQTGMPSIRDKLMWHGKAIVAFEGMPARAEVELRELREDTLKEFAQLRKEIENEMWRAEAQEVANMRIMQDRIDDTRSCMQSVAADARGQASAAIHSMGIMEKGVMLRMEEISDMVHDHASQQLSSTAVQLREEFAEERRVFEESIASLRNEIDKKASCAEMVEHSGSMQECAASMNKKVDALEVHYDRLKAWLENETRMLNEKYQSTSNEADPAEVEMVRHLLSSTQRASKPWTPSTAADSFAPSDVTPSPFPRGSSEMGRHAAEDFVSPFSGSSTLSPSPCLPSVVSNIKPTNFNRTL